MGIYILRAVIQVLHAEGLYFYGNGGSILKGIFAGGVGEDGSGCE